MAGSGRGGRAEEIAGTLRGRIAAGELRPGERVPSTRQIVAEFGVAMATATKVLGALRDEGLVRARPGTGTVVADAAAGLAGGARPAGRRAEPAPELSLDRIAVAAVALADAEGTSALTMRAVAARLGVATMSLYRYVATKDELLVAMADRAYAGIDLPADPPADWRTALRLAADAQWALYNRHPWLAQLMSFARPMLAPHGMRVTDWTLRALDGLDLDDETAALIAITVSGTVRGYAVDLESEARLRDETGEDADAWMGRHGPAFDAVMKDQPLTALHRMSDPSLDLTLDSFFRFSIDRMLDGVAELIGRRRRPGA